MPPLLLGVYTVQKQILISPKKSQEKFDQILKTSALGLSLSNYGTYAMWWQQVDLYIFHFSKYALIFSQSHLRHAKQVS